MFFVTKTKIQISHTPIIDLSKKTKVTPPQDKRIWTHNIILIRQ